MEPISNVDRLVMLLRRRLQERQKLAGAATSRVRAPARSALAGVQALAGGDLDDRALGRALIEAAMADALGETLVNAPQFQQVVDKVIGALEAEPTTADLLAQALIELRARPG